jgi:hypothetical protein
VSPPSGATQTGKPQPIRRRLVCRSSSAIPFAWWPRPVHRASIDDQMGFKNITNKQKGLAVQLFTRKAVRLLSQFVVTFAVDSPRMPKAFVEIFYENRHNHRIAYLFEEYLLGEPLPVVKPVHGAKGKRVSLVIR